MGERREKGSQSHTKSYSSRFLGVERGRVIY